MVYGSMAGAISNENALYKRNPNPIFPSGTHERSGRVRVNGVPILGVAIEHVAGERWRCGWLVGFNRSVSHLQVVWLA